MIKWNEVTWYSKLLAIIFFVGVFPVLCFYIGKEYGEVKEQGNTKSTSQMVPISASNSSEEKIDYVMQDISGFKIPQIINYSDSMIMQKVNKQLTDRASGFKCEDVEPSTNNYFDAVMKVTYNKNKIFSVSTHVGYYCQGPYPTNDSNVSVVFDMATGERVAFKDLFENYEKDGKAILSSVFENKIKETIGGDRDDQSCNGMYTLEGDSSLREALNYPGLISYTVEGDGISAQVSFPHVIEVCSKEVHISSSRLKNYVSSTSILNRVK